MELAMAPTEAGAPASLCLSWVRYAETTGWIGVWERGKGG